MSQISNEIRLEAVQRVAEDGMSISASARLAGVHKSMLQEWVMQYREHGAEGVIKQDRKQKKYTGEFKIEVVEYAHTNHLSAGAASAHFGLSTKSLFLKWERICYEEGPQALPEEHRGRASKMGKNGGRKRKLPDQTKEEALLKELDVLKKEHQGSLLILTARGTREEILQKVQTQNPIFCEVIPLTLEEIFISETEVAGYEVKNIFW